MFYFFEKSQQFVRCEIREATAPGGWEIIVVEPGGQEQAEQFPSSQAAHSRFEQLQARLAGDGWFGPYGRD